MLMYGNKDKTAMTIQDKDSQIIEVIPYFEVKRIINKIPVNIENDEVEIFYKFPTKSDTFRVKLADCCDANLLYKSFVSNKCIFNNLVSKFDILETVMNQLQQITINNNFSYEHKCLGWYNVEAPTMKKYFLYDATTLESGQVSICTRPCGKFTNGSEEKYNEMLDNYVFNNRYMSLAYVLGFTGVINALLAETLDLGVMLVGLSGTSSSGKTTAMKLMASIWGDTNDIKGTMILKTSGSENGLNCQQSGLFGVPILYDDIDTNQSINIEEFIYAKSKGTQRVVSTTKGEADNSRMGFSGIVITTSEDSLIKKTSNKLGLYARYLDLNNFPWTDSAESSNNIKKCVCSHYGFKGKVFGEFIQNYDYNHIESMYHEKYKEILQILKDASSLRDRICQKYAVIAITCDLINECFNTSLNTEEIIKTSLESENSEEIDNRDMAMRAYDFILSDFRNSKGKYTIKKGMSTIPYTTKERFGIAVYKDDVVELQITPQNLENLLLKNKFTQFSNYKKSWKAKGLLISHADRIESSASDIGRCYRLVYKIEKENSEDEE